MMLLDLKCVGWLSPNLKFIVSEKLSASQSGGFPFAPARFPAPYAWTRLADWRFDLSFLWFPPPLAPHLGSHRPQQRRRGGWCFFLHGPKTHECINHLGVFSDMKKLLIDEVQTYLKHYWIHSSVLAVISVSQMMESGATSHGMGSILIMKKVFR